MKTLYRMNRWRSLSIALACTLLLGCQTPAPALSKETKVATLKNLGFVEGDEGWELSLGVKLLFETDIDSVSDSGRMALGDVAKTLKTIGVHHVWVEGHTDNTGTPRHNAALSMRRADSVAQYLVDTGWPSNRIGRKAFGPEKPVADNASPAGRAQNRRVVITVQVE